MARKVEEQASNVAVMHSAKSATMSLMVELSIVEPVGHCPQNFGFNITNKLAKVFRMLKDGLHERGDTFDDGNGSHHVDSDADVFRYLLARCEVAGEL